MTLDRRGDGHATPAPFRSDPGWRKVMPVILQPHEVRSAVAGRLAQVRFLPVQAETPRLVCRTCGVTEREFKTGLCRSPGEGGLDWTEVGPIPYRVDNRLWVRERLTRVDHHWTYVADDTVVPWPARRFIAGLDRDTLQSLTMPRDASRLTLDVSAVRIVRLRDMTETDAVAEGAYRDSEGQWRMGSGSIWPGTRDGTALQAAREAWAIRHGVGAWDADPWTVVLTVSVVRANVDHLT